MKHTYIVLLILVLVISVFLLYRRSIIEGFVDTFDLYDLPSVKQSPNPSEYTAIMIEPRKHGAMEYVLKNFTDNLDERWNFIIFHGNLNEQFVKDIVDKKLQKHKHRITFSNLGVDNLTVAQYSELFYNAALYDNIPTEMFLVFQTDSMILAKNKDNIYKFMNFDYVGAPWNDKIRGFSITNGTATTKNIVGNGGLSLRRKSKMLEVLEHKDKCLDTENKQPYGKFIAEDQCFNGSYAQDVNLRVPTLENAKFFGVEELYSNQAFGTHKPWLWKHVNNYSDLIKEFPEIEVLEKLQKD